jgi:hypothetical protein
MTYPQIFRVQQTFDAPRLDDVPGEVAAQLKTLRLERRIQPGDSVAITCGSRGIANIQLIIREIVRHFQALGAKPFIVPAMGSHGGGTAAGQRELIEGYGVTEAFCGCPIRSSMETVVVCETSEGIPVHFDSNAFAAKHVVVCGRVKPHTGFAGDIESGLMKMMLIGLGKHAGAKIYHRAIQSYSFGQIIRSVAGQVLEKCRVVAGVAIVENPYDQTAKIVAVPPAEFEAREKELLTLAKKWLPRLPFDRADVLVVDEMGKNISGTGMDTNVIGRKYNDHEPRPEEFPKLKRIIVRSLTPDTHGNATGIGLSEFCASRVVQALDPKITAINCITGGHPTAAMVPIHFESDRELLEAALQTIGLVEPPDARLMWIRNTLDIAEVELSAPFFAEAKTRSDLTILAPPRPMAFDAEGNLSWFQRRA